MVETDEDALVIKRRNKETKTTVSEETIRMTDDDIDIDFERFETELDEAMEQRVNDAGMEMDATTETTTASASTSGGSGGSDGDADGDSIPDEDAEEDAAADEPTDESDPEAVTAEEAGELFDTSSNSAFMSDCMSAEPAPRLGPGDCQTLASELGVEQAGGTGGGGGDDDDDGDGGGGGGGGIDVGEELDEGNLRAIAKSDGAEQIWLLVEANDETSQQWMDTFEDEIQEGLVKSADVKMDVEAQDIVEDADVGELPALVVEHDGDYYVAE
jgi:uncharacterized membrane protein YukC